jgi:hypothetical protein
MKPQRILLAFACGCLLLGWPLLHVVERAAHGVAQPVLYLYLFGAWLAIVVLAALLGGDR